MYNYCPNQLKKRLGRLKSKKAEFWGKLFRIFIGTRSRESAYSWLRTVEPEHLGPRKRLEIDDERRKKRFENHRNDSSGGVCFCSCPATGAEGGGDYVGHHNQFGSAIDQGGSDFGDWLSDSCRYSCPATLACSAGNREFTLLLSIARFVCSPSSHSR